LNVTVFLHSCVFWFLLTTKGRHFCEILEISKDSVDVCEQADVRDHFTLKLIHSISFWKSGRTSGG
jgi:hypothetical protein